MTSNVNPKATAQFILGCIVTIGGLILLFIGCFIPPTGGIHSSLLVAFGEASTFAGALIGVDLDGSHNNGESKDE